MNAMRARLSFAVALCACTLASPERALAREDVGLEAALDLGVAFEVFSRHLRYEDDLYGFLRPYDLDAGPALALDARWYPGKHFTDEWPSLFGVEVAFERSFAIVSERADGARFPTANRIAELNALARLMIRRHALVARFGYGSHLYELRLDDPSQPSTGIRVPDVPGVEYRYLRYGFETRLAFVERVGVLAGASVLEVLDTGGLEAEVWFPHLSGNGIELECGVAFALPRGFEVRLNLDYRRYFFSFNPVPGYEDIVAGGALDQYLYYSVRIGHRF